MKKFLVVAVILAGFFWVGTATSKQYNVICDYNVNRYLAKYTTDYSFYQGNYHDTLIIRTYKDSLWDKKTTDICAILKDSCKVIGYKILVIDTTSDVTKHDTPYGHKVFFRQCP